MIIIISSKSIFWPQSLNHSFNKMLGKKICNFSHFHILYSHARSIFQQKYGSIFDLTMFNKDHNH